MHRKSKLILLTFLCDALAITLSVCVAYLVRFYSGFFPLRGRHPDFTEYMAPLLIVTPIYLGFFRAYGLYQTARYIRRVEEIFMVFKAVTFGTILLLAVTFFYRGFSYSRLYLVILWVCLVVLLSLARYLLIQWEYRRKADRKEIDRVLIVGANRNTRNIIQWARNNPHYGREVVGILGRESSMVGKHFEGVEVIGVVDECEPFIESLKPNEVILLETGFPREKISDLVALCEDRFTEFRIGADFYGLLTRNVDVEYISTVPLLGFRSLPLDDPGNRFVKRIFDILASSVILLLTLPFWIFVAVAVKMSDGGPIFYSQERMGRDQKIFKVIKFRTMKVDAEKETGPIWARANDSRRTKIGDFLRRTNLDELPQLLNVLKGDMSLVGPRPERPHFIGQFRESIPRYMARHKIKSGLTGWAQVNGYRGNTSIQERIKYDLDYMENWSLLLDVEILVMTFFAFKNAY